MGPSSKIVSLLYSWYYTNACNEWQISTTQVKQGNTAPKKRRSADEPLATMCPIWPALDLIYRTDSNVFNHYINYDAAHFLLYWLDTWLYKADDWRS